MSSIKKDAEEAIISNGAINCSKIVNYKFAKNFVIDHLDQEAVFKVLCYGVARQNSNNCFSYHSIALVMSNTSLGVKIQ